MGDSAQNWSSIISYVEQANAQTQDSIRRHTRDLNKLYLVQSEHKIQQNREERIEQQNMKQVERRNLEEMLRREKGMEEETKRQYKTKEQQYRDQNQLIIQRKRYKTEQSGEKEHPFVKLVDAQDRRRQEERARMRAQNQMNHAQGRINLQKLKQRKEAESQLKVKFVDHIEQFYRKKEQDRAHFKQKYLKLTNPQRAAYGDQSTERSSIEKEYSTVLQRQINERNSLRRQGEKVDTISKQINRHIETPDSSPAFIGRIPTQSDRKKQLEYLERGAACKNFVTKRVRTEGDIQGTPNGESSIKKIGERELPSIQRQQSKTLQQPVSAMKTLPSQRGRIERAQSEYNTLQQIRRKLPDESVHTREKKSFLTYDIIQGKKKYLLV